MKHSARSCVCLVRQFAYEPPESAAAPNCPHKLTKAAEPWLGGGAALGGSELHARGTSAAVRSCHFVLVAAAGVPLSGCRHGRRSLQLRVIALAGSGMSRFQFPTFNRYAW